LGLASARRRGKAGRARARREAVIRRLGPPPRFLATKIEAFRSRGRGDFLASHDMEDMVAVRDGRKELVGEVAGSRDSLRYFLGEALTDLLNHCAFLESVLGLLQIPPSVRWH